MKMDNAELICEYSGDTNKLREQLFKLLRSEDRIDSITLSKFKESSQANYPNRKIIIIFYNQATEKEVK